MGKVKALKINKLTSMQSAMLFYSLLEEDHRNYYEQFSFYLEGKISLDCLKAAWQEVINRHEIFRTDFRWKESKNQFQIVLNFKEAEIYDYDASYLEDIEKEQYIKDFKKEDLNKEFDFEKGRLNRVSFIKMSDEKLFVCWTFHHILLDGWSVPIVLGDFFNIYHCLCNDLLLPPKPVAQFSKYLDWLKNQDYEEAMLFWKDYMSDFDMPTLLPYDRKPKKNEIITTSINRELVLDQKKTKDIAEFCRLNNITMNAFLQTAWGILLQKYNNTNQSCFGMTVSGRPTKLKNVESIVGIFINTLPVVVKRNDQMTFGDLLKQVNGQLVEIRDYEYISLAEIQNLSQCAGEIFDSIIVFENYPVDSPVEENQFDFKAEFESAFELTNYNFTIVVSSNESIVMRMQYNADLFFPETIERMEKHLTRIMGHMLDNVELSVDDLCIVYDDEKRMLLQEFNKTKVDYPKEKTIQQLFEEQVARTPDSIAVIFEGNSLTYQELNAKANQLARVLRLEGVGPDQPVGIMVDKSLEMVIGVLAIIKAGGAYLPIDIDYPDNRIKYMLQDSNTKILLTQKEVLNQISFAGEIIYLEDEEFYTGDSANLENCNKSNDLVYIIYTSGSTGKPKGVMVLHKSLVNLAIWHNDYYGVTSDDNSTKYAGFGFDASAWEIFSYLIAGATIHIISNEIRLDINKLNDYYEMNKITISFLPTQMCEQFMKVKNNSLRFLLTGGDKLKNYRKQSYQLVNNYGPTENTVVTTSFVVNESYNNIPIGKPISNSQVYILDKNNQLQPSGVLGELCIGGEGLARGYLNRPELTQEKFIENPFIPNEKMYKTGDLARWLPNGNIEFLGRVDYQVKIRGFRIELGEIEERLARHAEIKEVVVLDRVDTNGTKYLCAYFVADRKISASELRTVLFEELPDYMIPSYFINLKKMPLTSNGKIDRRELPEPDGNIHTGKEYVAPTNEEEEAMVRIWMDILSVKQIGINDDFFELGGHSLKATQLTSKVLKEFNAELPLKEIFSRPTVKELVAYLSKTDETLYAAIEPVEENEYACSSTYLVSSAQKRLFALYQMEGENITYNSPNMTVIEGKLDKGRLYGVIKALIQRHEALRTSFAVIDGKAVQIIHPDVDFNVAYYEKAENELGQIINEFIQPFDLSKPPLCRAGLVKFAEDRHLLMLDMHHIISDGTSMSIFFTEFVRLYDDKNLLPLRIQYKDFAVWQNKLFQSEEIQRQEDYWMDAFAEEVPVLNLPTDAPRPTERSFEGDTLNFSLNKELTDGLNELASSNGATLYMTILATLNVLLSKYSNQSDIVIGSPIAGRRHADLENIMGMFINTLALRNYPEKDKTFVQFLNEVKENAFKAYENQDYQFEMLVEKLNLQRDLSRNPLFDVMFILQNTATVDGQIRDLKLTSYPFETKVAQFDLVFNAFETDLGIHFNLEYATKLFKRETIERMVDHLRKAIRQVLKNPVQLISEIEIISVEEKQQLLVDFNNTEVEIKAQTIGEMFEEQVIKTPDNIVGVFGEKHLTYSELNYKANQIARVLREKGVKPEQIVGIMVERSLEMMIGLLGIFKSGGAYLPIDPVYPEERIEYMLEDSQVKIVLTQNHLKDKLQMLNRDLLSLDDEELYKGEMSNLGKINSPHDLAYVIYTSGSTGKPKAVMIEHRNIVNTIVWRKNELQLSSNDKVLQLLSYSFDGFVVNFLTPIISGAQLIMLSNEDYKDPIAIKEVIRKRGITHFNCVPSLFSALLDCLTPKDAKTLRMIALGGEQITANLIERSKKVNSDLEIINEYGPTESSVIATALRGIQADSIIPIGRPIANTRIYIVDFAMKLVPVGVAGELCISGDGLARGYMNRPELVAEKFVQNPLEEKMYRTGDLARWLPNGMIEFLGRIDYQVKIRGYRIEIGEIEAQLLTHEAVREVVVTDREGVDGAKYLCAYFVSSKKLIGPELKSYLSSLLPEYMIPAFFIHLEKLPLTTNGKIDRRALPEPDGTVGTEYIPPTTESEEKMAKIWSAILGREKVGINDNFFELGGDSIKAIQIIARANQHEINISVKDIFKYKTIAEILRNVDYNKHVFAISQEEVVGEVLFTPVQKWFFDLSLDHGHFWNQTNLFTLRDDVDFKMLENVFKKLIAHHDALRMGYQFDGEYVIQFNRSIAEVDFKLERVDLSEYTYNIQQQKFKEACIKVQDQFDLEKDLLLKAVVFDLGKKGKRLFISIHHLVIDGVSWRILLEDLQNLYNSNLQVELPLKTTSFKEWSEQLRQYVKTEELDVSYWKKIDQSTLKSLIDVEIKENYLGDQQRVFFELDEVQTGKLLTQINWVYNTEINDILLSALTISLTEMIQTESVLLTLEGHGREEIVENVNLSRTIGWFTAGYPVCLQRKDDIGETIKHVKENLRKIPNKGLDFGLARYLADQMLETLEAEISFNYLGQFDGVLDKTEESGQKLLAGCSEDYGTSIHERNQHPTLLDIVGMVTDGKLKMMISYNEKYLNDEWIEELRDLYNVKLIEVIEHCVKKEDKSYTVSDFEVEDVWDNEDMDLIAGLYEL